MDALRVARPATLACAYVVASGVLGVLLLRGGSAVGMASQRHRTLATITAINAVGALLWPVLWTLVCGHSLRTLPPIAWIGLAWPSAVLLLNTALVQHQFDARTERRAHAIQADANMLSGLALAIGGLLAKYVSDGFALTASPMFVAALLLVLLIVAPNPDVHADSPLAHALHALQRVALQYCLGFILTSVAIILSVGFVKAAAKQEGELRKALHAPR